MQRLWLVAPMWVACISASEDANPDSPEDSIEEVVSLPAEPNGDYCAEYQKELNGDARFDDTERRRYSADHVLQSIEADYGSDGVVNIDVLYQRDEVSVLNVTRALVYGEMRELVRVRSSVRHGIMLEYGGTPNNRGDFAVRLETRELDENGDPILQWDNLEGTDHWFTHAFDAERRRIRTEKFDEDPSIVAEATPVAASTLAWTEATSLESYDDDFDGVVDWTVEETRDDAGRLVAFRSERPVGELETEQTFTYVDGQLVASAAWYSWQAEEVISTYDYNEEGRLIRTETTRGPQTLVEEPVFVDCP